MDFDYPCRECIHQCGEYTGRSVSDKSDYEWTLKRNECRKNLENNKLVLDDI